MKEKMSDSLDNLFELIEDGEKFKDIK